MKENKYIVKQAKTKYVEIFLTAKNKEEAEQKAIEGDYDLADDVIEGEVFFPTEWETVSITRLENHEAKDGRRRMNKMGMIFPQREDRPERKEEVGSYEQCKNMSSEDRLRVTRNLAMTSTRLGLEKMREIVDREIRLSDTAITEGNEEDDRQ